MEYAAVIEFILQQVAGGIIGNAGWTGVSWVLGAILGTGSDSQNQQVLQELGDIQQSLNELIQGIDALASEVQQAEKEIILTSDWNTLMEEVSQPLNAIETSFQLFGSLAPNDKPAAQQLQASILDSNTGIVAALTTLNTAILDDPLDDPEQPFGLLTLWGMACTSAALPSYSPSSMGFGSPLDAAYQQLESYFGYLVGVQVKGVALVVNAYTSSGEQNLAVAALKDFQVDLDRQVQTFLSAVESLVVQYGQNLDVTRLPAGAAWQADPMLRSGAFCDALTGQSTFYVRVVSGYATLGTFSVGGYYGGGTNPVSTEQGNVLQLQQADGTLVAPTPLPDGTAAAFSLVSVPGSVAQKTATANWTVFRFRWPGLPEGEYTLVGQKGGAIGVYAWEYSWGGHDMAGVPVSNVTLLPTNPVCPAANVAPPVVVPGGGLPARPPALVLSGRTALELGGGSACVLTTETDNPGEGDFTLLAWVLPAEGCSGVILSNKCGYGNWYQATPPSPAGASGVLFSLGGDGSLTLTVDNGSAYYSVSTAGTDIFDGGWHLVAGVRRDYELSIYLDGEALSTTPSGPGAPDTMDLSGCWQWVVGATNENSDWNNQDGFDPGSGYAGLLGSVSYWSQALPAAQLQVLGGTDLKGTEPGLVHLWKFDTGTTGEDASGGGSYVLQNSAATTFPPTLWYPEAPPAPSLALSFDGSGKGWVEVPSSPSLLAGPVLTVSAWVWLEPGLSKMKVVAGPGFSLGVGERDTGSSTTPAYRTLYPEFLDNEGNTYTFQAGSIPYGAWTLLTVNWVNGLQVLGYVNGQLVGSLPDAATPLVSSAGLKGGTGPVYFGIDTDRQSSPFRGLLGPVAISGADDVVYAGYWPLSDGQTTVGDQSGNGNDGYLKGTGLEWVSPPSSVTAVAG